MGHIGGSPQKIYPFSETDSHPLNSSLTAKLGSTTRDVTSRATPLSHTHQPLSLFSLSLPDEQEAVTMASRSRQRWLRKPQHRRPQPSASKRRRPIATKSTSGPLFQRAPAVVMVSRSSSSHGSCTCPSPVDLDGGAALGPLFPLHRRWCALADRISDLHLR